MFTFLSDKLSVTGQLTVDDVAIAAGAGFTLIINNRPDGEAPGQPPGATIEAAAHAAGLGYSAIPVPYTGVAMPQVEAMAAALDEASGPVLAFCKAGGRSAMLWALAAAHDGDDPEAITRTAATAGYDVSALMPALRQLAARAAELKP